MHTASESIVRTLHFPKKGSHKGQNGRLLIIGGSRLFHAASIWALEVASRIVDLVHYSSVPENNEIVRATKERFMDGIVVPRDDIPDYIEEDDCILIGPGMTRDAETATLTHDLLTRYRQKRWVIDAGALQMLSVADIPPGSILTPHHGEFAGLWQKVCGMYSDAKACPDSDGDRAAWIARRLGVVVVLKGRDDIVCSAEACVLVAGGNEGMTKGGTGDVLAGLIAALSCMNDPYSASVAGCIINKRAGDDLYASVGPFYNASDLASRIPAAMKSLLFSVPAGIIQE